MDVFAFLDEPAGVDFLFFSDLAGVEDGGGAPSASAAFEITLPAAVPNARATWFKMASSFRDFPSAVTSPSSLSVHSPGPEGHASCAIKRGVFGLLAA